MYDINGIISSLSTEDKRRFIDFLERRNKRKDAKNVALFRLLEQGALDSKSICHKLYGRQSTDAYHALRKRLFQSIVHFSANSSLEDESSIQMEVIKYILASRNYLQQKQYNVAFKILNKAELLAKEHHIFPLLNEIYHTQIQFAHASDVINLKTSITKFNKNKEKLLLEDQLNIVYATIKQRLLNGEKSDFQTILNTTLKAYDLDIINKLSFKSLYQLIDIISVSAFTTNSYLKIEAFLIHSYKAILNYKEKDQQPYYHIQTLYHIANTLFRNKKFMASLEYLDLMHQLMGQNNKKYYNTFKLKYYLLQSLNYNFSNRQNSAIALLEPLIDTKHSDTESVLDIQLSLVMLYFQKNDLKKASKLLARFYHSDNWYSEKAGIEWVIKKNLVEILLHIELANIELVESKLLRFKRQHYDYLKSIDQHRVITYMNLVQFYYKKPEETTSQQFKDKVESSFNWLNAEEEDIFVMSFYAWLKSKMDKQNLYTTTLGLLGNPQ